MEKIIRSNPDVDAEAMRKAQEALRELRRGGIVGPSYGIVSPYERRPVQK